MYTLHTKYTEYIKILRTYILISSEYYCFSFSSSII